MKREVVQKILAGLLFGLTAMFFVVSYFGMTTSGEDLFQGAGTTPEVWKDIHEAFQYDGRIPDMYAWTVINFFDYQYSFGVDTIFRLVDVVMGIGILYLMVYVALGRRLKFELKDAILWAIGFILLFLTQHGQALYHGFSLIHNYLLIMLITLGFGMWYLKQTRGEVQDNLGRRVGMLILGVLFGLSSNLTPVAFLLTFAGVVIVKMMRERKVWEVLKGVRVWEILGVIGILLGMAAAYIGGPGVSSYLNDDSYVIGCDYVSFNDIWMEPATSVLRLAKHAVRNAALVVLPIMAILIVFAGMRLVRRKVLKEEQKLRWWPGDKGERMMLVVLGCFMVMHILAATQLLAPLRLLLPAYAAGIIMVMILVREWTQGWKMWGVGAGVLILVLGIVVMRTVLVLEYHERAGRVLERIREGEGEVFCVTPAEVRSRKLPLISLGQDDMIVDWALPTRIYEKEVVWCEDGK